MAKRIRAIGPPDFLVEENGRAIHVVEIGIDALSQAIYRQYVRLQMVAREGELAIGVDCTRDANDDLEQHQRQSQTDADY